ncbi:MAG: ATP-binding cassette domain-containing protein, partial [Chloroflexota bacterium]
MAPLLELHGVTKSFGSVTALRDVDLEIGAAEAVGLIGDNGAGKSTLVKILSGVYAPTAGELRLEGAPVAFGSPADARRAGVEMIYQDLALCDDLDVAANIFLGREIRRRVGPVRILDRRRMSEEAGRIIADLGLSISPERIVGTMSGGERQMVAVARALQFQPRLLLMDDPVAHVEDVREAVADEEDAHPAALQLLDEAEENADRLCRQGGRRLVHEQQAGLELER